MCVAAKISLSASSMGASVCHLVKTFPVHNICSQRFPHCQCSHTGTHSGEPLPFFQHAPPPKDQQGEENKMGHDWLGMSYTVYIPYMMMNNECEKQHDDTQVDTTRRMFDLNCLLLLLTTASLLFSRCQWYFKAKMTSEEKRRTNYQNGHGKSIRPPSSPLS